jgi:hypothetical protein
MGALFSLIYIAGTRSQFLYHSRQIVILKGKTKSLQAEVTKFVTNTEKPIGVSRDTEN